MVSACKNKKGRALPPTFDIAHSLCFLIHDIIVQIIKSGNEQNVFVPKIELINEHELNSLNKADNVLTWLKKHSRLPERAHFLKTHILPYILSDMMHCIYESLETSRKGKLAITYMLIRKPIQESLYVLESIVLDELDFSQKLDENPLMLRAGKAGGIKIHIERIEKILNTLDQHYYFDAEYIARLRYDKNSNDNFDGVCNRAIHLFTEHEAIRTENMNINFIFSQYEEMLSQWNYFYSRLPYLLFYIYQISEHLTKSIAQTSQEYLNEMQRKISALVILWSKTLDKHYICKELTKFIQRNIHWLNEHCTSAGYKLPREKDLIRMYKKGAYPRESLLSIKSRHNRYTIQATINTRIATHEKIWTH